MRNEYWPITNSHWDSPYEYIQYLQEPLIPDLKKSGHIETAKDFEDAVTWIEFLLEKQGGR